MTMKKLSRTDMKQLQGGKAMPAGPGLTTTLAGWRYYNGSCFCDWHTVGTIQQGNVTIQVDGYECDVQCSVENCC